MRTADGEGSANDPAVEIRERLAAIEAEVSEAERDRQDRRAAVAQELYDVQHRVPGTPEHASHRDQLVRLYHAAERAVTSARAAERRTSEHLDGARAAVEQAEAALNEASEALQMFAGDHGTPDGSAE